MHLLIRHLGSTRCSVNSEEDCPLCRQKPERVSEDNNHMQATANRSSLSGVNLMAKRCPVHWWASCCLFVTLCWLATAAEMAWIMDANVWRLLVCISCCIARIGADDFFLLHRTFRSSPFNDRLTCHLPNTASSLECQRECFTQRVTQSCFSSQYLLVFFEDGWWGQSCDVSLPGGTSCSPYAAVNCKNLKTVAAIGRGGDMQNSVVLKKL